MAKKYAFLFPGQGAQTQGMIKDIVEAFPEAKKVVDEVARITGQDIQKLLWEMPQEELNRSDNSQLAITTASLAIMAAWLKAYIDSTTLKQSFILFTN